mmetsp:Transcript_10559/g.31874  ORF Transcript_10559/g.31874 Transcript_10559/m.31874 type:complete len:253 (-) Transcript_10559:174-932(-)
MGETKPNANGATPKKANAGPQQGRLPSIMRMALIPLVAVVLLKLKNKAFDTFKPNAGGDAVIDAATGVEWAPRDAQESRMTILGAGVRAKNLGVANVNVYSVALYAAPSKNLKRALRKGAESGGPKLFNDILDSGAARKLHLKFVRGVGQRKVVDALTSVTGVSEAALTEFSDALKAALPDGVSKGQTISLGWPRGGLLVLGIDGSEVGKFRADAKLPHAVYELFLGKKAVSPALLASIEATAAKELEKKKN